MSTITAGRPIVIDFGSAYVRSGVAGEDSPRSSFPPVLVRTRGLPCRGGPKPVYYGEEAYTRTSWDVFYSFDYARDNPTQWWDLYEQFLNEAYSTSLPGVASEEHPVLLTENMFNPPRVREGMAQIMIETFRTPALYLAAPPVLALLATGATTGLVVDSGVHVTNVVPVYRGHATQGSMPFAVAGDMLTTKLQERFYYPLSELKRSRYWSFKQKLVPGKIKEAMCFVSQDYAKDLAAVRDAKEDEFLLPDGNLLDIGISRFQIPEAMFQPSILEFVEKGIHEVVADAIVASEPSMRSELISNIVLAGGNTKIPGFENRLRKELGSLDPSFLEAGIVAPANREWSSWLGGSMLSSLSTFGSMCIRADDYDEYGPTIIHRQAL